MKKGYTVAYINYIVSALWYIAAVIGFINDSDMATMWLCLGSVWLCIGSSSLVNAGKKAREEEEKKNAPTDEEHGSCGNEGDDPDSLADGEATEQ